MAVRDLRAIDPLHKWRLNLNNNTHTSIAFVVQHECEAKDVQSIRRYLCYENSENFDWYLAVGFHIRESLLTLRIRG